MSWENIGIVLAVNLLSGGLILVGLVLLFVALNRLLKATGWEQGYQHGRAKIWFPDECLKSKARLWFYHRGWDAGYRARQINEDRGRDWPGGMA